MRITNNMLIKDMLWNANKNLNSMAKSQTELSTGQKIHRPSDDPVGITQVLKFKTDIREAEQFDENIRDALGWLEVSESSLHDVKNLLQRVRELTVQAANGTNTADDTAKIRTEIEQLTKEIIVLGNSTIAGRYIFSGLETNKELFKPDGTYNIDMTSERSDLKYSIGYEVSVGEVMPLSVHPADIFGVINNDSFFTGVITRDRADTPKSTQSIFSTKVDLTADFSGGDVLDLELAGIVYDVDESLLDNTITNPMTKARMVEAYKNATSSIGALRDVADIYFDQNDKLVVVSKAYGSESSITDLTVSAGLSENTTVVGMDAAYTQSTFKATVDLTVDYSGGDVLDVDINGDLYNVDESVLIGSVLTPLTQADLINAYKNAPGGAGILSDVADVYFGSNNQIVIKAKVYGSAEVITDLTVSAGLSDKTTTVGIDLATKSKISASVDLTHDYSAGDSLDIDLSGVVYNVDESLLAGSGLTPLTQTEFIDALKSASDGVSTLSSVADIYFDTSGNLIIQSKTAGSSVVMTDLTASIGLTGNTTTLGLDGVEPVTLKSSVLSDAGIAAFNETSTLMLTLDGTQKKIDIDFSVLNSVDDLVTEIQNRVDAAFGSGKINISGFNGMPLEITLLGSNDGDSHQLKMDFVYATESELIHDLKALQTALTTKDDSTLQVLLGKMDAHLDRVFTAAGEIGGKTNRIEFIANRIEENKLTFTGLLSKVQDVDMAESIMFFKNLENVYRASLSVGSKVIQPSLVDFLR